MTNTSNKALNKQQLAYNKLNATSFNLTKDINSLSRNIRDIKEKFKWQMQFPGVNWTRYDKNNSIYMDTAGDYKWLTSPSS
jgi:hypothetical protein